MTIDEQKIHTLTNYTHKKKGVKATKSDHNVIVVDLKLKGKKVVLQERNILILKMKKQSRNSKI